MNYKSHKLSGLSGTIILNYLCVLLIILQCRSWMMHINGLSIINAVTKISIAIILLLVIILRKKYEIKQKELLFLVIYNLSMVILCAAHREFTDIGFISNDILIFSLSFVLFCLTNYKEFLKYFSDIVYVICVISIFFFVFSTCLHLIKPTFQFVTNWGNTRWVNNYFFVYTEMQSLTSLFYTGFRNTAIWVEGPMLAFPVCIALYYEVFLTKNINKYRIFILLLTIVTAFTTTGIIISASILVIKYFIDNRLKKRYMFWIIFIIIFILFVIGIDYILKDKMTNSSTSYNVHFDDISSTFQCFFEHPIVGVGYNNIRELDPYREVMRANAGVSTGLGCVMAYGGIIWGAWYLIPLIISIKHFITTKSLRPKLGFIIFFNLLLFFVLIQETALCVVFNAISWKIILDLRENNEN